MNRTLIACVVAMAACAAPADPGLRPHAPSQPTAGAGVDWAETQFTGAGGIELYAQRWRPPVEPKAVVVIHHGLADHSDRYAGFAEELVGAGFAVWAFDMRGHGRSAGRRVTVDRIDDMLDDLDAFLAVVRDQEPGRAIFLYGHSLGGLVTCLYTIEREPEIAGLVLAAPGIAFPAPPLQAAVVRLLGRLNPNAPALETPHGAFSRRPEVVAEMDADPLIYQRKAPVRTARAAVDGVARVWSATERLRVPLLAIHGTADALTAPSGSRDLVAQARSEDKTLRLYDGFVHDLLREPDGGGEQVKADVIAWLDARAGGASESPPSTAPTGRLRGDQGARAMSIELDLRGELPRADALGGDPGVTAGLRLRLGFGRATGAGLGYLGGLDVRAGVLDGGVYEADAHVAGLALRSRSGALLALTGGVGIGGVRGAGATHAPLELGLELPAGPLRVLARANLGWRLGGSEYTDDALGVADEAGAFLGVRLGRDRRYWADVSAGVGPYLALTYRNLGGAEVIGVALGLDVWGGS
jgi:alpha-beta hydrolase superfamily lysophospholipase